MSTRRRGDELLEAIYEAALEQVSSVGYAKLTMEGVAAAAHTGKAALYRRWPDKNALLADTLSHVLPSPADVTLTDTLRTDLLAVLHRLRDSLYTVRGAGWKSVKGESGSALMHSVFGERVSLPCRRILLEILRRGAERGEVRKEAVTEMVAGAGYSMTVHHFQTSATMEISDEFLNSLVDEVILPMVRA